MTSSIRATCPDNLAFPYVSFYRGSTVLVGPALLNAEV